MPNGLLNAYEKHDWRRHERSSHFTFLCLGWALNKSTWSKDHRTAASNEIQNTFIPKGENGIITPSRRTLEKRRITVFENRPKSRIQHCERSELRLHFEKTKVHWKCQKRSILASFWKPKAWGKTKIKIETFLKVFSHCDSIIIIILKDDHLISEEKMSLF